MAAGVTASLTLDIVAKLTGAATRGTAAYNERVSEAVQFTPGTDAIGKANLLYTDERTLAASATEDLDLAGALSTPLGATIAAAEAVLIFVKAADDNTNNVVLGGAASNAFVGPFGDATDTLALKPGEFVCLCSQAGWAVTAGTGDILKVANSGAGTGVTYEILVIARTAAA